MQERRASLDDTTRDVIAAMSFFSPVWVPIELFSGLTASANIPDVLDALVATMCVDIKFGGSLIRLDRSLRKQVRCHLIDSPHSLKHLTHALDALDDILPQSFTKIGTLAAGRNLHNHVISALTALMSFSITGSIFSQAASLAFLVCEYLMADGKYGIATEFMGRFHNWCQWQFPTAFSRRLA